MSYLLGSTFDLEKVWLTQSVTDGTRDLFKRLASKVFEHLTSPPGRVRNVSEWAKKEECWLRLREQPVQLGEVISELVVVRPTGLQPANGDARGPMSKAENLQLEQQLIGMVGQDWYRLARWVSQKQGFSTWQKNFVASCAVRISRGGQITAAQMPHALRIYMDARAGGFNPKNDANQTTSADIL
jgi:hypothetical protein